MKKLLAFCFLAFFASLTYLEAVWLPPEKSVYKIVKFCSVCPNNNQLYTTENKIAEELLFIKELINMQKIFKKNLLLTSTNETGLLTLKLSTSDSQFNLIEIYYHP